MTRSATFERWRPRVRLVLFVAIAGYILLGPVPHQVFQMRHSNLLPRWRMFSGMSMKACAGHFERRDGPTPERLDDWFALLKLDPSRRSHRKQARVNGVAAGEALGERLCATLGPGADVRLFLRCPSRSKGWVSRAKGERNLCVPKPKASNKGGKKGRRKGRKKRTERIKRARSELPAASNASSAGATPVSAPQTKRSERSPPGKALPLRERPRPPPGRRSHEEPTP